MKFVEKIRDTFSGFSPTNNILVNKKEWNTMMGNVNAMIKTDDGYGNEQAFGRPSLTNVMMDTPTGGKLPLWRITPLRMYEMSENIAELRTIHEAIQREMFRNGLEVRPKYKYRCDICLKQFKNKPTIKYVPMEQMGKSKTKDDEMLKCDECENEDPKKFSKPKPEGRVILQTLLDRPVNNNDQTLKTLGRQYERHLDIMDQGYSLFLKDYIIGELKTPDPETGATKEIKSWKFSELMSLSPIQTAFIANNDGRLGYDSQNNPKWICPNYLHRDKILEKPVCDKCGCKALNAIIEINSVPFGYPVTDAKLMWYARGEVIFTAGKYYPDMLYGNSPINAIWRKAMSLFHQDEYVWKYFDKDRPPKSILGIASRNYETAQSFMDKQKQGARADPFMPRPILVNTDNISQAMQYIDLTPNFKELELTELRSELRQIIGAIYGLQPINSGEQGGGGLGDGSLQLTLSNRTIKTMQRFLNENYFHKVSIMMEVYDWEIVLVDSEEIDKLRDEQIRGVQIENASKMYQMGFDVWTDGDNNLQFSQYPNPERQQQMNGMGSNVKQGNLDKTKKTTPKSEQSTNFDGEPLNNSPSDVGGAGEGSPSSGFSLSKKSMPEKPKRIRKAKIKYDGNERTIEVIDDE